MKELVFSPRELKNIIENSKVIGSGFFGTTFLYQGNLIKLDKCLYNLLKVNDIEQSRSITDYRYRFIKKSSNPDEKDFNSREQIEELVKAQKNITLTKLPLGIVTLRDVDPKNIGISPGIIIPYHENHNKLEVLPRDDYKKLLIILKKLLLAVRELADYRIAQEDLVQYDRYDKKARTYNVMYRDNTPQIIDMSGDFVKVGSSFQDAKGMYRELGNVVLDYFTFNNLTSPYAKNEVENEKQIEEMLQELINQTKGK